MKKISLIAVFCISMFAALQNYVKAESLEHECTSWIVFSDLTKNNTNILHKNRDSKKRDIVVALSPASSPRKWIGQGNPECPTNMAMNTSGLAGVMNSGEKCINHSTDKTKKGTPAILRGIIESCDTAAQAVEKLKEILKSGDYWHWKNGSIFFFCAPQEGYVCEMTAKDITVVRYDNGYTVRANIWLNPGMQKFARNGIKGYLNSAGRMFTVISRLNKALDKTGNISVAECIATSRNYKMPAKVHDKRSVCGNHTNSAATFEIDKEYPAVLSTAYFTTGHPLHTICVPVPVCAEKLHPAMGDLSWTKAAFARRDKLKLKDILPEWAKFEQEHMATYNAAKDQARKLLAKGKRTEAVKMLNDTAWKIWEEAAEKLSL